MLSSAYLPSLDRVRWSRSSSTRASSATAPRTRISPSGSTRRCEKGTAGLVLPRGHPGGKKLHEQIDEAIRVYDKLLLVLSPESMDSEWVRDRDPQGAEGRDQEKRRKLFPIRLVDFETIRDWECFDADSGKDLGVEIREYFIPDFSNWKDHDAFEAAFARLLKDLKAEELTGAKPV